MTPEFNNFYKKILKSLLTESISFSLDSEHTPEYVYEIASAINYSREFQQFLKKNLTPEQYSKPRTVPEVVTIDGYDTDSKKGIINFYTADIPEDKIDTIVSFIKYYIGEHNGELTGEPRRERSNMFHSDVIRFPVKVSDQKPENTPEINLANATAKALLVDILNYSEDVLENYEPLLVTDLLYKIETIEDNDYELEKGVRPEERDGNVISFGLSKERIKSLLDSLKNIAEYALKNNYTYIRLS